MKISRASNKFRVVRGTAPPSPSSRRLELSTWMAAATSNPSCTPDPLQFKGLPETEMLSRGRALHGELARRRSVREFSSDPVPRELVELATATAGTAPSGASRQPLHFVAAADPARKAEIRQEGAGRHQHLARVSRSPGVPSRDRRLSARPPA